MDQTIQYDEFHCGIQSFIFNIFFKSTQATGLMMALTFFQTTLHLRNRFHTNEIPSR